MTEPRSFGPLDLLLFAAVVALAALLRIGYLVGATDGDRPQGYLFVQDFPGDTATPTPERADLTALVDNVRFDRGFIATAPFATKEEPTAHTAPGYPMLVGLLARVVDPAALDSWVQWIQALVGSLTAGLYFLFARRAFRSTLVALLAGVLTAIYPLWVINTAAVNDGTLTAFLLALVLWLGVRAGQSGGAFSSLLLGLMLAGLALTRAYYFPFTLVALGWFLLRSRLIYHGWLCALVAFLGYVAALAPWIVRNYERFQEPVPIVDSAFYHVWIGNNPLANGGPATPSMIRGAEAQLNEGAPLKLGELEQPERYSRLGTIVRETAQNDPLGVLNWRIFSTLDFLLGEDFRTNGVFAERLPQAPKKDSEQPADSFVRDAKEALLNASNVILAATMILMLGLGFLGWRWTYGWRTESMPAALAMIWIPLPYILTHAEALHGPRLPLDGVLLSYVAFGLCCFLPGVSGYLFGGAAAVRAERP
jgi:4-amino-4-deoxy-L-arabinose transferase-like glycosyltransferase